MIYKFVITGPSGSGKTSVLRELKSRGYAVLEEVAEEVLNRFKDKPDDYEHRNLRQRIMCDLQYYRELSFEQENTGPEPKILILDRGLHDYIGFSNYFLGGGFSFPVDEDKRYCAVISLSSNGFIRNDIRVEKDFDEAKKIYEIVRWFYEITNHPIIDIPNLSSSPSMNDRLRADLIEKSIKEIPKSQ